MANRLKELRLRAKMTQDQVGEASHPPTSKANVERKENAGDKLDLKWMERLAPAFKLRPAALMDPLVELLPYTEGDSDIADQLKERLYFLSLWDSLSPEVRAPILLMMKQSADMLRAAKVSEAQQLGGLTK